MVTVGHPALYPTDAQLFHIPRFFIQLAWLEEVRTGSDLSSNLLPNHVGIDLFAQSDKDIHKECIQLAVTTVW